MGCWPSGLLPEVSDVFGAAGQAWLRAAPLELVYRQRIDSQRELIDAYDGEIECFRAMIANRLRGHRGYRVIQQISGVGPTFAAVLVAEIGDVNRFSRPEKLCCWAGLTPRHRESDATVHRGPITKQGSRLVRWAAIEAVQRTRPAANWPADRTRIITARGRNIGVVAAARRAAHPGLLRPARRTDPRAGRRAGRVSGFGPGRARGRCLS